MIPAAEKYDVLVVGLGIAGVLLTEKLIAQNLRVLVFDTGIEQSSSHVAAGIINPITGRNFVKSWNFDKLLPYFVETYGKFEKALGIQVLHRLPLFRALKNQSETNEWIYKSDQGYMNYPADVGQWKDAVSQPFDWGQVMETYRVDMGKLIKAYRDNLAAGKKLYETEFEYDKLNAAGDGLQYGHLYADKIVFCEGAGAVANPYFNYLPFRCTAGEVLILESDYLPRASMIKNNIFIVPVGDHKYWAGSSYKHLKTGGAFQPDFEHLKKQVETILKMPYKIVDYKYAIRPTTADRRPFLGVHPEHKNMFLFNGLGTKGASMGPYLADMMVSFMIQNEALDQEVDINRF